MSIIPAVAGHIVDRMVHGSYYTANSILTDLLQQSEKNTLKALEVHKRKRN